MKITLSTCQVGTKPDSYATCLTCIVSLNHHHCRNVIQLTSKYYIGATQQTAAVAAADDDDGAAAAAVVRFPLSPLLYY